MLSYPAKVVRDGKFFMVSFPDFPGVYSQGDTEADALRHGQDALETALYFLLEAGESFPPCTVRGGQTISTSVSFDAKLLLIRAMVADTVLPSELARRLGVTPQEVTRLIDLRHKTKIEAVALALKALGKTLEVSVVDAR